MTYNIGYDLDKPDQNYAALTAYLTKIGAVRVLESQWVVRSDLKPLELLNAITAGGKVGSSDRLLVGEMPRAAWRNLLISTEKMQVLS